METKEQNELLRIIKLLMKKYNYSKFEIKYKDDENWSMHTTTGRQLKEGEK